MFYLLHSCITFTFSNLIFNFNHGNSLSRLFPAIMSSNPIIALLVNEKLNGDNYVKWKSNINIVLICENQKFILTEECPPEPHATASRSVRETYDFCWLRKNILRSRSNRKNKISGSVGTVTFLNFSKHF